jgi:hypothetical protein
VNRHLFLLRAALNLPDDWDGPRFEVWRHVTTDEAFAVALSGEDVAGAVPVNSATVDHLPGLCYSPALGRQVACRREEFTVWASWVPRRADRVDSQAMGRHAAACRSRRSQTAA